MTKNLKKISAFLVLVSFFSSYLDAQQINQGTFGQNAWYVNIQNPSSQTSLWSVVGGAGVKFARVGGADFNFQPLYDFDPSTGALTGVSRLKTVINDLRAQGN